MVLWSYHTTPQSATRETSFKLTNGTDTMIPIEILESSPRKMLIETVSGEEELRENSDLLDEVLELAKIKEEVAKQ